MHVNFGLPFGNCERLTPRFHRIRASRVTAEIQSPELIAAVLDNACVSTTCSILS